MPQQQQQPRPDYPAYRSQQSQQSVSVPRQTPQVQSGVQQAQGGLQQGVEGEFEATMSPVVTAALDSVTRVKQKAKFTADAVVSQRQYNVQSAQVVRAAEDISEVAEQVEEAILRNSASTTEFSQTFLAVATKRLQDLQSIQQQQPSVLETVSEIQAGITAVQQLLAELGQQQAGVGQQVMQQPVTQQQGRQQVPIHQQPQQQTRSPQEAGHLQTQ